jgi:hypothetical protein
VCARNSLTDRCSCFHCRDNPLPLTRAWCLWELFCTVETGSKFNVFLGPAEHALFESQLTAAGNDLKSTRIFETFTKAFDRIDVSKSMASKDSDLAMILGAVDETPGGCDSLNKIVKDCLVEWLRGAMEDVLVRKAVGGEFEGFLRAGVAGAAAMVGLAVAEEAKEVMNEAVEAGSEVLDDAVDAVVDSLF